MITDGLQRVYYYLTNKINSYKRIDYERMVVDSAKDINPGTQNEDKIIYIIKRENQAGFFSNYFFVLGHCIIANNKGWIPVVDMKNYPTLYNENKQINETMNSWEYYFSQPSPISLDDAYKSRYVKLSSDIYPASIVPSYGIGTRFSMDKAKISELSLFANRYANIHCSLIDEFETEIKENDLRRRIGVHVRGTDMRHTAAHPLPPTLKVTFKSIDKMVENKDRGIYLCTDEENIVYAFRTRYGNRVLVNNSYRSQSGVQGIHIERLDNQRENHKYLLGKEVLRDVYCLSKCNSFVGGRSNVAYAAIILNNNMYETCNIN